MTKLKPYSPDPNAVKFHCPGCKIDHYLHIGPSLNPDYPCAVWSFNGNFDVPTLNPSILARGNHPPTDEQCDRIMAGEKIEPVPYSCHSFIRDGMIEFLTDSSHSLAGQTVPLPDIED